MHHLGRQKGSKRHVDRICCSESPGSTGATALQRPMPGLTLLEGPSRCTAGQHLQAWQAMHSRLFKVGLYSRSASKHFTAAKAQALLESCRASRASGASFRSLSARAKRSGRSRLDSVAEAQAKLASSYGLAASKTCQARPSKSMSAASVAELRAATQKQCESIYIRFLM